MKATKDEENVLKVKLWPFDLETSVTSHERSHTS